MATESGITRADDHHHQWGGGAGLDRQFRPVWIRGSAASYGMVTSQNYWWEVTTGGHPYVSTARMTYAMGTGWKHCAVPQPEHDP